MAEARSALILFCQIAWCLILLSLYLGIYDFVKSGVLQYMILYYFFKK